MVHFKCCLCGKDKQGFGHSCWPIYPDSSDYRCCDNCNKFKVIPARVQEMLAIHEKDPTFRPED